MNVFGTSVMIRFLILSFLIVPLAGLPVAAQSSNASKNPTVIEFVRIAPGEFMMGCATGDEACDADEKPAHRVQITKVFEIGTAGRTDQPARLSKGLLRAGIEEMTAIGEWRTAIVNAIQNNNPVAEDQLDGNRRTVDSKLELASTSVATDADRNLLLFLRNESGNMQRLSAQYLAMRKSLTYIAPDSLDNDPLNQQIQDCARGLASLTESGQFQDVATCH